MDEARIIIRAFEPETDQPCIYATWRNGSYYGALKKHKGSADKYFRHYTKYIKETLEHENCHVRIACIEDDPIVIIGYSVFTKDHLDWIFVKADFRLKGIASLLYPTHIVSVTDHLTKIGNNIASKKNLKIKENPYGRIEERISELKRSNS